MINKSGRTFTISIKPSLTNEQVNEYIKQVNGVATLWAITHDKDFNESGEIVEPHTHVLLDYRTPRKISTVANLFNVEPNFIELVRNKISMLRYLTHLDDETKYQYDGDLVITNDKVPYSQMILSSDLTNQDIVKFIKEGKGLELIDLVPVHRLRAVQSFLHFDNSNTLLNEVRAIRNDLTILKDAVNTVLDMANQFKDGVESSAIELTKAMIMIATELNNATIKLSK
jgi:hypothetical protein